MKRRLTCAALALALCLGLPARAADTGFFDVAPTDWFAPYVEVCVEAGLMNGVGDGLFAPQKNLTGAECAALAARLREDLTGKAIPALEPGSPWYQSYVDYLMEAVRESGSSLYGILPWYDLDRPSTRREFLVFLALAVDGLQADFSTINSITTLPDAGNDNVILFFYNAGILTGVDKYGTFAGSRTLTRAEVAAMMARTVKPELRLAFTPADYSPFTAAYLTPDTVMFDNGVTAEEFLREVNISISAAEYGAARLGQEFNWHYVDVNGKTRLENVKAYVLEALGVTEAMGTQAYRDFDYQVYYARLIDLTGETFEPDYAVGVGS